MTKICPNHQGCRLVRTEVVEPDPVRRDQYIADYCVNDEEWKKCVRYQIRKSYWICPDFILPDSKMKEDEILERYEQEKESQT